MNNGQWIRLFYYISYSVGESILRAVLTLGPFFMTRSSNLPEMLYWYSEPRTCNTISSWVSSAQQVHRCGEPQLPHWSDRSRDRSSQLWVSGPPADTFHLTKRRASPLWLNNRNPKNGERISASFTTSWKREEERELLEVSGRVAPKAGPPSPGVTKAQLFVVTQRRLPGQRAGMEGLGFQSWEPQRPALEKWPRDWVLGIRVWFFFPFF